MYFRHMEAKVVRDLNHTQSYHREGSTGPHLCNECRAFSCEQLHYDALDAGSGIFHDPSKGKFLRRVSSAVLDLLASQCEVYRLFRWQLLRHSDAVKLVLDWIELEDPKHMWEDGNPSLTVQCLAKYQEKEEPEKYNLRFNISDSSESPALSLNCTAGYLPTASRRVGSGAAILVGLIAAVIAVGLLTLAAGVGKVGISVASCLVGLCLYQIQMRVNPASKSHMHDDQDIGVKRHSTTAHSLSPARVSKIQNWVFSSYKKQWRPATHSVAPARLIYVGRDYCRLITTSHLKTVQYATLSYCWGDPTKGKAPLRTKKKTLRRWEKEQIPEDLLPQTLKDALHVVRCLGIEHLWIDSLCIIQDSEEDWQRESQKMAAIYQDSLVTIVSLMSESCHDGFLKSSALPEAELLYVSNASLAPKRRGSYFLEACPISFPAYGHNELEDKISKSVWNTRGWTFQEFHFARQLLVFAESEMFFTEGNFGFSEAGARLRCRSGPHSVNFQRRRKVRCRWDPFEYSGNWNSVVEDYSSRSFTKETDRLPAIDSYAESVALITGDEYLAGLWKSDFHRGMLWSTMPYSEKELRCLLERNSQQRVQTPSWSWARHGRKVSWPGTWVLWTGLSSVKSRACKLEAAGVSQHGMNKFGQFNRAWLVVSGTTRRLSDLRPRTGLPNVYEGWVGDTLVALCWTDWEVPVASGQWVRESPTGQVEELLMLHTFTKAFKSKGPSYHQLGVLLLPTGTEDEYWRVGVFKVCSDLFFVNAENRTVVIV